MVEKAILFKSVLGYISSSSRFNTCLLFPALSTVGKGKKTSLAIKDSTAKSGKINTDTLGLMQSMQVEFKDGNIERIQVVLQYRDTNRVFSNNYPIPFSTERDYKQLNKYLLFSRTKGGYYDSYGIRLGDFLQYIPYYRSGRRDFSPANGTLNIDPKRPTNILSKGRLQDLFEVVMYTDFVGLQQTKPNGLIQFDLNKKCPFNTPRVVTGERGQTDFNFGFVSYIVPELIISKIENNNRNYPGTALSYNNYGQVYEARYITPTDLLNYSNTRLNVKLNLITVDLKQLKSEMFLNTNGSLGLTGFADSVRAIDSGAIRTTGQVNVSQLPFFTWNAELGFEYQGDERFGFRVNGEIERPWITDRNVEVVANLQRFEQTGYISKYSDNDFWMFNLGFKGWVKPGGFQSKTTNTGNIFFRAAFTQSIFERPQHFYQLQLGYEYNIFAIRKK